MYLFALFTLRKGLRPAQLKKAENLPFISIVVSMHNEQDNARACIEKLLHQNYPDSLLEIIVVDDRSTDDTGKIIKKMASKNNFLYLIEILDTKDSFAPKKFAIDQAVKKAKGEIIVLTDADGRPGSEWLNSIVALFGIKTGMVIGYAPYSTSPPYNNLVYRLLALEYLSHAAIAFASTGLGYPLTCVGTNMAYRKEVYAQLNGFGDFRHIHTGDDDLFLQRVREETDWEIIYNNQPEGHVFNDPPDHIHKFFHQRLRYASKGFIYPKRITISLLALYLFNVLIFVSPLTFFYGWLYLFPSILVLLLKAWGDWQFLKRASIILHDTRNLKTFPLAFILHIPYVLLFGLLAQFKQFKWGNRTSK
jgi:cellulose synthase/poly-beta-1,6-N-acetylglucosamine synthase-like glycosyltransferase